MGVAPEQNGMWFARVVIYLGRRHEIIQFSKAP